MSRNEIVADGKTVWVNCGKTGGCLGRFGTGGIDIHKDVLEQEKGGQCLDCTHTRPTAADWQRFVKGMAKHHGVRVAEKHRPRWLDS